MFIIIGRNYLNYLWNALIDVFPDQRFMMVEYRDG